MIKTKIFIFLLMLPLMTYSQDNEKLKKLYGADQDDRKSDNIDWVNVLKRDHERISTVSEMVHQNQLKTSNDFYHAAMIFQHGNDSTSYKMARDLSKKAFSLDSTNTAAKWLIAASHDRYLLSIGKKQWYGTQFIIFNKKWYLRKIDSLKVTDADRIYYGTGTLNQVRQYLIEKNGNDDGFLIEPDSTTVKIK